MNKSENIGELAAALCKAQAAFPAICKDREVTAGKYSFKYATLDAIISAVRKPLSDNGLSFVQSVAQGQGGLLVDTLLAHTSGQWIETTTPVKVDGTNNQAIGSAQTYGKRYALSAILGIVADEDDDGNLGDGKTDDVKSITTIVRKDAPGITKFAAECRDQCREVMSCPDVDSLMALLGSPQFKKFAVKSCGEFPSTWTGSEEFSGLRGMIEKAGKDLGCEDRTTPYIVAVENAARKPVQQAAE